MTTLADLSPAQQRALEWLPDAEVQQIIQERSIPEPNSGCWLWERSGTSVGYGNVRVRGQKQYAHRASYEAFVGRIPAGHCICHRCDTPACVNPAHLFTGTLAENNSDMRAKGKQVRAFGEMNPSAKVSPAEVQAIRAAVGNVSSISRRFGYSRCTVREIRNGKRWGHVPGLALKAAHRAMKEGG